jgi:Flp pilus assembly protein TadG
MRRIYQPDHKERGQSMVELALSFTLLVLLLAGVVDLGRAFYTFISLRDAAQEGALYGSTAPSDTAGIVSRACNTSNYLQSMSCGASDTDIIIEVFISDFACINHTIQVQVTYQNYPVVMPFAGIFFGEQTIPLRARVNDTILRPPCE